eukprot:918980-Pyramimonas_sp.AAC.1
MLLKPRWCGKLRPAPLGRGAEPPLGSRASPVLEGARQVSDARGVFDRPAGPRARRWRAHSA